MSHSRSVAHTLEEIAVLLELRGEDARARSFRLAAHRADALADETEVGEVAREIDLTGGAILLDALREETPEGFFEMLRLPGLGPARIRRIVEGIGTGTLPELQAAARDGRLAALPRFGQLTAERVLRSIIAYRAAGEVRRHRELVREIVIVAACDGDLVADVLAFAERRRAAARA